MPGADNGIDSHGTGRAALLEDGVEFDDRDARLLRAIADTGSVARASSDLERSRARALARIEVLEEVFGTLVERTRGGVGGGGSRLTESATALLNRFDRLSAALAATASVPETVLSGTVIGVDGELATVETPIGSVRGVHGGLAAGDDVQVRISADAVTLQAPGTEPEPDTTSARNRRVGTVDRIDERETIQTVHLSIGQHRSPDAVSGTGADNWTGFAPETGSDSGAILAVLITDESADRLSLAPGDDALVSWKATATRLIHETRHGSGQDG